MNLNVYVNQYRNELLQNVLPFWLEHSRDPSGGYYTCLLEDGRVFDQDKFIWLQCRQVYTFAFMFNAVKANQEWLDFAIHGAEFLVKHGRDARGDWYFSLARDGKPLVKPYNIFSDCFACLAFGQLYKATQNEVYAQIARNTFTRILTRKSDPKGRFEKTIPETRPLKNFALPMIICNLCLENAHLLEKDVVNQAVENCLQEVMTEFYNDHTGLLHEFVQTDGSFVDSFEGRLVNPGHAIEAMWFIMDLAQNRGDQAMVERAIERTLRMLDYGWDQKFGGIFYFLDAAGYPPQQLEWNQKLWWVHLETLVALLKGYQLSGDQRCWDWFEKVHEYTWYHFPDPAFGEWWGYLSREGEILLHLKGGKWKGCFHLPRALYQSWNILEQCSLTRMS